MLRSKVAGSRSTVLLARNNQPSPAGTEFYSCLFEVGCRTFGGLSQSFLFSFPPQLPYYTNRDLSSWVELAFPVSISKETTESRLLNSIDDITFVFAEELKIHVAKVNMPSDWLNSYYLINLLCPSHNVSQARKNIHLQAKLSDDSNTRKIQNYS